MIVFYETFATLGHVILLIHTRSIFDGEFILENGFLSTVIDRYFNFKVGDIFFVYFMHLFSPTLLTKGKKNSYI